MAKLVTHAAVQNENENVIFLTAWGVDTRFGVDWNVWGEWSAVLRLCAIERGSWIAHVNFFVPPCPKSVFSTKSNFEKFQNVETCVKKVPFRCQKCTKKDTTVEFVRNYEKRQARTLKHRTHGLELSRLCLALSLSLATAAAECLRGFQWFSETLVVTMPRRTTPFSR